MDNSNISASTVRKNMLWNVTGSVFYCAVQWVMSIAIVHLSGYEEAGYLALALSITNVTTNVAYFCIRNYQVSDIKEEYSSSEYVSHRFCMSVIAMAITALFIFANGYSPYLTVFLLLFMVYRLSEPVVDVFHGIDQKHWRLDIAGKSFFARGFVILIIFVVLEKVTGNLIYTTLGLIGVCYSVIFFFDIPFAGNLSPFRLLKLTEENRRRFCELTIECFPLFVYAVCLNAVVPVPRYFLELTMGDEILGYYSSVAMPASIIQLLSSYVFTTFTALFAEYHRDGKRGAFTKLFLGLSAAMIAFTAAAAVGAAFLGRWVLVLVFDRSIEPYAYLLAPTIVCCGIIALVWFTGTLLIVMRQMHTLIIGSVTGLTVAAILSKPLIGFMGIDGVNLVIGAASAVTLIVFLYRVLLYRSE